MRVSELLDLKPLSPVIRLEDRGLWEEVAASFVWTRELKSCLEIFARRLGEGRGGGVFLRGHYGTGKSHLLAFLALQSAHWNPLRQALGCGELPPLLPVTVSLVRWRAELPLEDILREAWREALPGGRPVGGGDRRSNYLDLLAQARATGRRGFLILLDELSEFLRSKRGSAELAEDIRFLQFLGEFSAAEGCWVIAALQEEIEGMGQAPREAALKLKDRYPDRWVLAGRHLEEMLPSRVIAPRPGAEPVIAGLATELLRRWPGMGYSVASALRAYPLHPGAFDLLQGLGPIFSEHRGALHFLHHMLKGGWREGVAPFLDRPAGEWIDADLIYDYFAHRLLEIPGLRDYGARAYAHLEARATELLASEDHPYAFKVLKIAVLCSLEARRAGVGALELAALANQSLGGDEKMSREYLEERVLKPLYGRAGYLAFENGRWRIDPSLEGFAVLGRALERRGAGLDLAAPEVRSRLMQLMDRRPFEFAAIWRNPEALGGVAWLNTHRALSLAWGAESAPADLVLLFPGDTQPPKPLAGLVWIPRAPDEPERRILLDVAAGAALAAEEAGTAPDLTLKQEAAKWLQAEAPRARAVLEEIYGEGLFLLAGAPLELPGAWREKDSLEGLLEEPAHALLLRRHPRFPAVAPRLSFYNDRMLAEAIELWVRPGALTESELTRHKLLDVVLGIARPLGLVEKARGAYRFVWDGFASPAVAEFERLLKQSEGRLGPVRQELAHGDFGLPRLLLDFLIFCAIAGAGYEPRRKGETLSADKVSFRNLDTLEALGTPRVLATDEIERLLASAFFRGAPRHMGGLALQNALWTHAEERLKPVPRWLEHWRSASLEHAWAFAAARLEVHRGVLETWAAEVVRFSGRSREGLERLLAELPQLDALDRAVEWGRAFDGALKRWRDATERGWSYLRDEFLDALPPSPPWAELAAHRQTLLEEHGGWTRREDPFLSIEPWLNATAAWECDYRAAYAAGHRRLQEALVVPGAEAEFRREIARDEVLRPHFEALPATLCNRPLDVELESRPYCRCGFAPGAAKSAAAALSYEPIFRRLFSLGVAADAVQEMRSFIKATDWPSALALWHRIIEGLRAAPKPRRISLKEISSRWQGRAWTRAELLRDFEKLLGEDPRQSFTVEE